MTIEGTRDAAPAAVHGARHAESDRAGGHVSAARGAARPLPPQGAHRLSRRGGRSAPRAPGDARQGGRPSSTSTPSPCSSSPRPSCSCSAWPRWSRSTSACFDYAVAHRARDAQPARHRARRGPARRDRAGARRTRAALAAGRAYVTPDDIKAIAIPALRHRIGTSADAEIEGLSADTLLGNLLDKIRRRAAEAGRREARPIEARARADCGVARGRAAAAFVDGLTLAWQIAGVVLAAALAADAFAGIRIAEPLSVERRMAANLALGRWTSVTLRLSRVQRAVRGWMHDAYPPQFDADEVPQAFAVEPGQTATLPYRVRPLARGNHRFGSVAMRIDTPLRLWQRGLDLGSPSDVRVYPDFARITQYTLLATDNRLSQIGVLQRRRRGEGLDFHQLREYRQGDTSRQIDWKATARVGRLISREYQDERDQRIVFLVDCGQRMRAHEGGADARSRAVALRPRAQCPAAARLRGATPGRRGRRADLRPRQSALARAAQVRRHREFHSRRAVRPRAESRSARLPGGGRAPVRAPDQARAGRDRDQSSRRGRLAGHSGVAPAATPAPHARREFARARSRPGGQHASTHVRRRAGIRGRRRVPGPPARRRSRGFAGKARA